MYSPQILRVMSYDHKFQGSSISFSCQKSSELNSAFFAPTDLFDVDLPIPSRAVDSAKSAMFSI